MRVQFQNRSVHCEVYGSGNKLLICLHGYGNTGSLFRELAHTLPENYCLVAPDLPGFGQSPLETGNPPISKEEWKGLFQAIVAAFPENTGIALLGYSIGGRVALEWLSGSDIPVEKMILIASDGLRLHPFYRFCVFNPVGRILFKGTMRQPGPILFLLRILHKLRLVGRGRFRMASGTLAKQEERERLEKVWLGYRKLSTDRKKVLANEYDTKWLLVWGEKDKVIKPKWGERFAKQHPSIEFKLIRGGHALLVRPSKELQDLIDNILIDT